MAKARRRRPAAGLPNAIAIKKSRPTSSSCSSLFENLWARRKFDVLGKKRKGEKKRVGLSRSLAVEKRRKTLLPEYKKRGLANAFLDRRFGERDEALAEEDRAIIRFQRERQAQLRGKRKYLLTDDDDDEVLTHGGIALDDFKDDISMEDDDEQGLDDRLVRELHFGSGISVDNPGDGGEHAGEKPRSKKEIMEEIIAKSKFYKAQKAKEKEEDANLKDQLDKEFAALAKSQAMISLVPAKGIIPLKSHANKEKPDDYDKLVKGMVMEYRAHASDRLKTAEEIAQEEKTHLEELERKRQQRMLGEMDSDESEQEEHDSELKSIKQKRQMGASGDDLCENFLLEEVTQKKGWVDEVLARRQDDSDAKAESSDGVDSFSERSTEENDVGSDFEEDGCSSSPEQVCEETDEIYLHNSGDKSTGIHESVRNEVPYHDTKQGGLAKDVGELQIRPVKKDVKWLNKAVIVELLPFVIEAPKTIEELKELVDNRSVEELAVAIQRIRTCNAICLATENRRKMQIFYGILLQYFATLADENPFSLDRVNALVKPLMEMSSETPYFAAVCAREWIVHIRQQLSKRLRNSDGKSCWPPVRVLLLLRLWSMIFPPSDFRHVVMTPSMLLMSEYLMRCPVNSGRDIAVGIFLCALLLAAMRQAKRFCPEALCFLYATVLSALPEEKISVVKSGCPDFMVELVASQPWLLVRGDGCITEESEQLEFNCVMISDESSPFFCSDKFRLGALWCVTQTLQGFIHIYEDLESFPEIFYPFLNVLQHSLAFIPDGLKISVNRMIEHLTSKIGECERLRQPLQMRIKKQVPIKQFNPRFEENYVKGRDYDPDRQRAERKKLQRLLKKEARGAARELRKDNYFLQEVAAKEKAAMEEEKAEKNRKDLAFLQEQATAFRSGQLGKGRRKRR
eukprot:c24961_g1_i1 orf=114-2843(+)